MDSGATVEGLARDLYMGLDYPGSIEAHERAFAAYKEEGDALGAARAARVLAWLHWNLYGNGAVSGGWLARAGGCSRRLGRTAPSAGGSRSCGMFQACERSQDVARAEQWLHAADDIVRRWSMVPIGAFCRAHYAGILTAAGRWEEAEAELDQAGRIFARSYAANRAGVQIRLADLRVRQGRFEEAAVLLDGLDQHPEATRPLAALDLARGDAVLACDRLERRLAVPGPHPQIAASLLALLVDAHLAQDDVVQAGRVAERLEELAAGHPGDYAAACAALARGKVCLRSGIGDARACLHDALAAFSRAQMPVELARARLELARAAAQEQPEVAIAEARAALDVFEQRPAARDADAAASLLRSLGAPGRSAPRMQRADLTRRELEVLELLGHGLSNPEIAERLYISRKTAEHHVGHVLSKLGLRNRAEAAAYAMRSGTR